MPWKASDRHLLKALQMWYQWAQTGTPAPQDTLDHAKGALFKQHAERAGRLPSVWCCA